MAHTKDHDSIVKIRFEIEDILTSPEKLFDKENTKRLQVLFNKYVYGEDFLEVDGIVGPNTLAAINDYKEERKYWNQHGAIQVNPLHTKERYDLVKKHGFDEAKLDSLNKDQISRMKEHDKKVKVEKVKVEKGKTY
tara:strand:- start:281 stop:688 length:408 start_codon:yes stop_codon:yes gene_type:complete